MRTLVTGGIRSGKSTVAEALMGEQATYVATGQAVADDADWAARVEGHRRRRPATWRTVETTELPEAIGALTGPALVDGLGGWLVSTLDRFEAWDAPVTAWRAPLDVAVGALVDAWVGCPHDLVAVSDEVGFGGIAAHRSARIHADELGLLNQRIAAVSDRVLLVVAGQVLTLKDENRGPEPRP